MVFKVKEGGDQSSPTDGKRGTIENYGGGGGDGGDHKNIKILKNLSEDQVSFRVTQSKSSKGGK